MLISDQTNKTVTKESQINRCLLNKHAWEKLTEASTEEKTQETCTINGNTITATESRVDHAAVGGYSISVTDSKLGHTSVNGNTTERAIVNGNVVLKNEHVVVNGFVAEKVKKFAYGHGFVESCQHEGPSIMKRPRQHTLSNDFAAQHCNRIDGSIQSKLSEECDVNHNQHAKVNSDTVVTENGNLSCQKTVLHAFPSISHCIDWIMAGNKLRNIYNKGRECGKTVESGGPRNERNAETEADLEGFDDNVPDIGDKYVHILVTGSLHLVGGALRVIQGEDACS